MRLHVQVLTFVVLLGTLIATGIGMQPVSAAVQGDPVIPLRGTYTDQDTNASFRIGTDNVARNQVATSVCPTDFIVFDQIGYQNVAVYGGVYVFHYKASYLGCVTGEPAVTTAAEYNLYLDVDGRRLRITDANGDPVGGDWSTLGATETMDHATALQSLLNAGIPVTASGCNFDPVQCLDSEFITPDKSKPNSTSLKDIRRNTVAGIIKFKYVSGQSFNVTGGTEDGHASGTYSHGNGYKVDISYGAEVTNHIKDSYGPATTATEYGSSYPAYLDGTPSNEIFYDEETAPGGPHWDVLYR